MKTRRFKSIAMVLLAFSALAFLACSDDDTNATDVQDAVSNAQSEQGDVCDKLDDLDTALDDAASLSPTSTVNDAKEVQSDVEDAVDAVASTSDDAATAKLTAIETATKAMKDTLGSISGDQTLGQAAVAVRSEAAAITSSLSGLRADSNCS